jgi:D-alanine-D-alanine ligase
MNHLNGHLNGNQPEGEPPPRSGRRAPWRIVLTANPKGSVPYDADAPPDAGAEYDSQTTLDAIAGALQADGHWVHVCTADHTLPQSLLNLRPHIVFNIAEGVDGDAREAQVPALCELLHIPYTASRVLANAVALDKTQTKRIWQGVGLPTAPFQEVARWDEPLDPALDFPLFVKPAREGTGMGMGPHSIVYNEQELRAQLRWVIANYQQPALVEPYLPGREFTVGFIGNPISSAARRRPGLYDEDGYHFFPILEIDTAGSVTPAVYGSAAKALDIADAGAPGYLCPADVSQELRQTLVDLTRRAAEALGVCDVARVDFRLDGDGRPLLLEINTLPGLNPRVSDICMMAAAEGMAYEVLIGEILYLAAGRFLLPFDTIEEPLPLLDMRVAVRS